MQIILSAQGKDGAATTVSVNGLIVTVNGVDYDLSAIPEGGQAEATEDSPFIGTITRDKVNVLYQFDSTKAEPHQSTNWADYTFDITNGEVPCPIKWKQEETTNELP